MPDSSSTDNITKIAYSKCSVYPTYNYDTIREHTNRMLTVISSSQYEMSDEKIATHVANSLDIKSRMNKSEWIQYDGELKELNR